MVPTPCSYSRRICSNNSTLALLFTRTRPFQPQWLDQGTRPSSGVGQIRASKWAKSEYRNHLDEDELRIFLGNAMIGMKLDMLEGLVRKKLHGEPKLVDEFKRIIAELK